MLQVLNRLDTRTLKHARAASKHFRVLVDETQVWILKLPSHTALETLCKWNLPFPASLTVSIASEPAETGYSNTRHVELKAITLPPTITKLHLKVDGTFHLPPLPQHLTHLSVESGAVTVRHMAAICPQLHTLIFPNGQLSGPFPPSVKYFQTKSLLQGEFKHLPVGLESLVFTEAREFPIFNSQFWHPQNLKFLCLMSMTSKQIQAVTKYHGIVEQTAQHIQEFMQNASNLQVIVCQKFMMDETCMESILNTQQQVVLELWNSAATTVEKDKVFKKFGNRVKFLEGDCATACKLHQW